MEETKNKLSELIDHASKLSLADKIEFKNVIDQLIQQERQGTYFHVSNILTERKSGASRRAATSDLRMLYLED